MSKLCSDQDLAALVEDIRGDDSGDLDKIDRELRLFPEDPRLHFLRGSTLAGKQRAIEAHQALQKAVELAPDYTLARYQLGFFELTSGEADRALSTWGPLLQLPIGNYLRRFVEGLTHLIRDEFGPAIEQFEAGMALNGDNPPMNHDIGLLLAECRKALGGGAPQNGDDGESATSFLLGQLSPGTTHH
ncbi:tetratricopeptide (TPR) repeat protein [Sphingopyxis panaciterrae]|uniref:tetratricopeptide repeat protein n=1 Tax=Sphingopyxis panaciterrae TaxID=363841 RepID=UPI00141E4BE2|nr:hypothetical protein [Sphingopyxis panaciterrae]NIJ36952.1 tetratricopeptide (TPR) repeat protein [Sphingopyxis panaciterrae]